MDPGQIVIAAALICLILLPLPFIWFVYREVRKTFQLYDHVAERYQGRVRRIPPGANFTVHGQSPVRVYAFQGTITYDAPLDLGADPRVLVIRSSRLQRWLAVLNRAPGRRPVTFGSPIDERFSFQSVNPEWVREIFTADILKEMDREGALVRLEIKRTRMIAMLRLWWLNESGQTLLCREIDLLNCLLERIRNSTGSLGG